MLTGSSKKDLWNSNAMQQKTFLYLLLQEYNLTMKTFTDKEEKTPFQTEFILTPELQLLVVPTKH